MNTRLDKSELWPEKLPNSILRRAEQTIAFIEPYGFIADCGEYNPMAKMIEDHFGLKVQSLNWNFDYPAPITQFYDTILCFEVLEHLFNPLIFLDTLHNMLFDDGVIYLSTPYQYPQCLKAIHHYHEIPTDRLMWLFEAAGLEVEEQGKVTIAGKWYEHIGGIRPMLRYFQKSRIYKLRKIKD